MWSLVFVPLPKSNARASTSHFTVRPYNEGPNVLLDRVLTGARLFEGRVMPVDTRIGITAVVRFPIIDQAQGLLSKPTFCPCSRLRRPVARAMSRECGKAA